jgi:hypothetical protein
MEMSHGLDNVGLVFLSGQIFLIRMHRSYGANNTNMTSFWEPLKGMASGMI